MRTYGWRAYALPLLVIVTVLALMTTKSPASSGKSVDASASKVSPLHQARRHHQPARHSHPALRHRTGGAGPAGPSAGGTSPSGAGGQDATRTGKHRDTTGGVQPKADTVSAPSTQQVLAAGALPAGPAYTEAGDGTFHMLPGTSKVIGSGTVYRYAIEVEGGIRGINLRQYADLVQTTLSDPRSWAGHEWNGVHYALQRVDSGKINFYVTLTSSYTVRKYCGYDVPVETSCYVRAGGAPGLTQNRVFLNDARWVRGAKAYGGDLHTYRVYMINHEDGHALGHNHAHECLADGLAPAMMQQTYGLIDARTHRACRLNPWPYPPGATDAPGAEQLDTSANDELRLAAEYGR